VSTPGTGPLIVQSDKTLLLEVDHEGAAAARTAIAPFAELERAPEHVHTYRVTPLALWNARAAGHDAEQVVDALVSHSRFAVPQNLLMDVVETMGRYGRLQLTNHPAHGLVMVSFDRAVLAEVTRNKKIAPLLGERIDDDTARRTRSSSPRTTGSCGTTRRPPSRASGRAAPASSSCPAAPGRPWSARPPWPGPRRRR
jgi:DNA excision repair protein ERCC-3